MITSTSSLGPKGQDQKGRGKSGIKHDTLHRGTVLCAEQDWGVFRPLKSKHPSKNTIFLKFFFLNEHISETV